MKSIIKLTTTLVLTNFLLKSQTTSYGLVNKLNETITSATDTANLAPIVKAAPNTYVVSTNNKVSSTQNDIKTTCLNGNIAVQWSQQHNAGVNKAFSTANARDNAGNIIVVGSTNTGGINGQDITVIKYAPSGGIPIWVKYYNGPGNSYDVASSLVVDAANNIYVTGASVGGFFQQIDYVTIKFNSNGTQLWASF